MENETQAEGLATRYGSKSVTIRGKDCLNCQHLVVKMGDVRCTKHKLHRNSREMELYWGDLEYGKVRKFLKDRAGHCRTFESMGEEEEE
ncbi:hypothetical protein [Candidatus Magnetobacterium casense]|uniref:Uncharacterized protein n=1 Tax=Candidatus Magnetobacterium casense TaxID=1455061 RepID=A0ABS6S421_9BACT|nr:hypothetical protein [Candidatus Magnetobacterium casensis]MBV6343387.1 hypothetical protein [Candidatus Magnetobacterium casensis]